MQTENALLTRWCIALQALSGRRSCTFYTTPKYFLNFLSAYLAHHLNFSFFSMYLNPFKLFIWNYWVYLIKRMIQYSVILYVFKRLLFGLRISAHVKNCLCSEHTGPVFAIMQYMIFKLIGACVLCLVLINVSFWSLLCPLLFFFPVAFHCSVLTVAHMRWSVTTWVL